MRDIGTDILDAIRSVVGRGDIALHEPSLTGIEKQFVIDCIESTFVSSVGEYVGKFERLLEEFTGIRHAIAVVNGTAALHAALRIAGVERDDEVFIPALSFVATANAVRYLGAVPHFLDSNEKTLGLDPEALKDRLCSIAEKTSYGYRNRTTGRRLRALVPMHTYGHPCELDELLSITREYKLKMVEDAAESLGSFYKGKHTGGFGEMGILSFNGNKIVTTGGGGAILTNDAEMASVARHLTTTAKIAHSWSFEHDKVGYNYRMPNLNAALGCGQMQRLPSFLSMKKDLKRKYAEAFEAIDGVRLVEQPADCSSNYWLQTLILSAPLSHQLERVLKMCCDAGLRVRPSWTLLSELKPYAGCPAAPLPVAQSLAQRIINIPSSVGLL